MAEGVPIAVTLIGVGFLLLLSILASKASIRLGVPALILFIGIGMLAGSEGLGGIDFEDYDLARNIGTVALALILFAGGLETKWQAIRPVLFAGLSLATVGVAITAGIVGYAAAIFLGFDPLVGFLLGAIVSSTDAAAVFGILRARAIHLKQGLGPLLEFESGSNDPMAVFLTTAVTALIASPGASVWPLAPEFFLQMTIGVIVGYLLGTGAAWFINRLRLEYAGLYSAATIGTAFLAFGGAEVAFGNPFLAVYVCGLTLGNKNFLHKQSLIGFHDGVAWLMQITMFLVLGLLVFPTKLLPIADEALIISGILVFIARPAAVFISLIGVRGLSWREKLFTSWVGLRGAVPIILATIPLTAGIRHAEEIFNVVFFAVLTSVLLQGTLIGPIAKWLKVTAPGSMSIEHAGRNMIEVTLSESSPVINRQVVDLKLPRSSLLLLVTRDGESFVPQGSTLLHLGDTVLIATRKEDLSDLAALITGETVEDGEKPESEVP